MSMNILDFVLKFAKKIYIFLESECPGVLFTMNVVNFVCKHYRLTI